MKLFLYFCTAGISQKRKKIKIKNKKKTGSTKKKKNRRKSEFCLFTGERGKEIVDVLIVCSAQTCMIKTNKNLEGKRNSSV